MNKIYDELKNLKISIEETRIQLHELMEERKNILDLEVIQLSERLDDLLAEYIKKSQEVENKGV